MHLLRAAAAAALALVGLSGLVARDAAAFPNHVFVVTGDTIQPGNSGAFDLTPPWSATMDLGAVGPRPGLRHALGLHWVVDRSPGGAITAIDPITFDPVSMFAVGGMPYDILVLDTAHAWVTRHDSPWLLELNPSTGSPIDSLDLGMFADSDGIPEFPGPA